MTTYISHAITGIEPRVNKASVKSPGPLMVQLTGGTCQLDLIGTPADFVELAARLIEIAVQAEDDRARAQMDPFPLRESHTTRDLEALTAAGVDPSTVQPREHDVACVVCQVGTWNLSARCDAHYVAPRQASVARAAVMS